MDGDRASLKRTRNPSGPDEKGADDSKIFKQNSKNDNIAFERQRSTHEKVLEEMPFSSPTPGASERMRAYGAVNSIELGHGEEPMEWQTKTDEENDNKEQKKEKENISCEHNVKDTKVSYKKKEKDNSKNKRRDEYKNSVNICRSLQKNGLLMQSRDHLPQQKILRPAQYQFQKRVQTTVQSQIYFKPRASTVAEYVINIKLCQGEWKQKPYTNKAKEDLLMCINAAGNSYGNRVQLDCTETRKVHKKDLDLFYMNIEKNELRDLLGEELLQKDPTEKELIPLHVPMFKKLRSVNTNIFVPKFESVNMLNDEQCRDLLQCVRHGTRDTEQRKAINEKSKGTIDPFLKAGFKYNGTINCGKETPGIQFKYLEPERREKLAEDCFSQRNKLQKYISAFATHNGGVILYGIEDKTGYIKGQILSHNMSMRHSFGKLRETLKNEIPKHTKWWNSEFGVQKEIDEFVRIDEYPLSAVPEAERKGKQLASDEYFSVICITILPFVMRNENPLDGIVFGSGEGPEAYKIDGEKLEVQKIALEDWLREMSLKTDIDNITGKLKKLGLSFESSSEKSPVFQVHDTATKIREKVFKVTANFDVHPKDFVLPRKGIEIQEQFQRSGYEKELPNEGIILADKELSPKAVNFFVISRRHGLYFYSLPLTGTDSASEHLQKKAIALKASLCSKGGCSRNLEIHIQIVGEASQIVLDEEQHPLLTDKDIKDIIDSYICVVGSFENKVLSKQIGVEIFNVLTESQFEILFEKYYQCRELWIHGLAGSGKTILAQLFIRRLVESGEGKVLYVAENLGIVHLMKNLLKDLGSDVICMTRWNFRSVWSRLSDVCNVVMDEVHHYQGETNWLRRARTMVSKNKPMGYDSEGYLWLFMDMYQKENRFKSGIPKIRTQKPRVQLQEIVRCTPTIWENVREKLRKVAVLTDFKDETEQVYKDLLEKSHCPKNVVVAEDNIRYVVPEKKIGDDSDLQQVDGLVSELLDENWRAEDIALLFSTEPDAHDFKSRYNERVQPAQRLNFISCTDDCAPGQSVCDSVRRFAGLDKPCVILVEPSVYDWSHDRNAFEALGMSRAMVKLIVIQKPSLHV